MKLKPETGSKTGTVSVTGKERKHQLEQLRKHGKDQEQEHV